MESIINAFFEGSVSFWGPAAILFPVVVFMVGYCKYYFDEWDVENPVHTRRGYSGNLATWAVCGAFVVLAEVSCVRPMTNALYGHFATGVGNKALHAGCLLGSIVFWGVYGMICFSIGKYASRLRHVILNDKIDDLMKSTKGGH